MGGIDSLSQSVNIVEQIVPQGTDTINTVIIAPENALRQYELRQNYPNPFNPQTIINYELQITNYVMLTVYDIAGKEIETLVKDNQNAGSYQVIFDGSALPSGIYFYRLTTSAGVSETRKMMLLK